MKKSVIAMAVPVMLVAGCGSKDPQPEASPGARPITLISPTPSPQPSSSEVSTAPTSTTIPESPKAQAPDSMPRDTNFNSADVEFVSESVVRSQRVAKATELYLKAPGISAKGQEIAKRLSAQHSATLTSQQELLAVWGVSTPEAIFPANPAGIPTEAEIDQMGALHGADLDRRYVEMMLANLEGFGRSAQQHLTEGFNPEVREAAELTVAELEKEKASMSEALN